jgi:hypothetical protein
MVAMHDDPAEQLESLKHELVHVPPGAMRPSWQSVNSHSLLFMQGPPTNLLALPASPGGRSSPPHASASDTKTVMATRSTGFMADRR